MSRCTPPQNALLKQIRLAGSTGLDVSKIRGVANDATLTGLVRRQLVTISFGRAYSLVHDTGGDAA